MLRKLSLITALVAALAVPATDALAWGRGGGGRGFGGRGFGGHGFYGGRGYYAAMAATMAAMGGPITAMAAMAAMAATMAVTGGPITATAAIRAADAGGFGSPSSAGSRVANEWTSSKPLLQRPLCSLINRAVEQ
jgi:hypothetical protein